MTLHQEFVAYLKAKAKENDGTEDTWWQYVKDPAILVLAEEVAKVAAVIHRK